MQKFFSLLAALALLGGGPAAAEILDAVERYHCVKTDKGDIVPGERVFELALAGAGLTLTLEERRKAEAETPPWTSFAASVLKARPSQQLSEPKGLEKRRQDLYVAVESLVGTHGRYSDLLTVRLQAPPETRLDRVADFLMQRSDRWLEISCAPPAPVTPPVSPAGPTEAPPQSVWSTIQIGRDLTGAKAAQLKNRSFALFSAKWDEASDQNSFSIEGVALYPALLKHSPVSRQGGALDFEFGPYVGFKRLQAGDPDKEINDLTFGGLTSLQLDGSDGAILPQAHYLHLGAEWISDDSFESSMYRAELIYRPSWAGRLGDDAEIDCGPARCMWRAAVIADFADVKDATGKPALSDVNQFGRIGGDLSARLAFGPETAKSNWRIELESSYQFRDTFTDDEGDAGLFKMRLAFVPSENSLFSFGLDYVQGEDLTSLVEQEYWALSIGVRK